MFNPTTENLWLEVKAAVEETRQHTEPIGSLIRRTTSRWYRADMNDQPAEPENHGYAYVSNMLPQLVSDYPQVDVKAARVVGHKVVASAMKDGTNAWIRRGLCNADRGVGRQFPVLPGRFAALPG